MSGGSIIEEATGEISGNVKHGGPGRGSTSAESVKRLGGLGDIALKAAAGLVLLFLFLPILVTILFSFNDKQGKYNLKWQGFTLEHWLDPLKYPELNKAFAVSIEVAVVATAVSVVLGSLVAIALVRQRFRGRDVIDTSLVIPLTVAEVVMGASLLTLFLDFGWNRGFWTIVLAHIGFQLSFVALTVRARVRGHDWTTEDAALDLGAGPTRTFLRVTLPLIMPGIVAAALLAFALSLDDFIITVFNAGSEVTYPLFVNNTQKNGVPPQVNVLATTILVASLLLISVGTLWRKRRES
jgi:spermidine/putrescine transport system permease protein